MSCLGVTGKPMVVTYLGRSGNPTDELPCNMDIIWTTYYEKDSTWIVLELIGVLEQRIRVYFSKVNALRFTLVMTRKHERQTGVVMNDLARLGQVWRTYSRQWKGCCQTDAEQFLGKIMCSRGEEG